MLATSPRKRFDRLVELAERGPECRDELLGELHALLDDWPADYPAPMRDAFAALLENVVRETSPGVRMVDAPALVQAARTMNGAFLEVLATALDLDAEETRRLLNDASGDALARACRSAHLDRATYSAIVVLTAKGGDITERLTAYDRV
jgi:ATP/maltotriose-dependent transcriptional regulator MalT